MSKRFGTLLVIVLALVAAACGNDDGGAATTAGATTTVADECAVANLNLVEPGVLTIATGEPAFPPWVIDDDPTNKQGFEGAVAYAVAGKLGFGDDQVKWVRTGFDEAIAPGPKNFDFNLQQYSINAEREQVVDFSTGYYTVKQALVAYADSPIQSAETIADLKAYRLGAAQGTTSLNYIEDVIQPDEKASVYEDNSSAKLALDANQIDALVFDLPTAYYITAVEIPDASIVALLETPGTQPEEFGLMFAKGNSLVTCVDQALAELEADGTLAKYEQEWIVQAGDLKVIGP